MAMDGILTLMSDDGSRVSEYVVEGLWRNNFPHNQFMEAD